MTDFLDRFEQDLLTARPRRTWRASSTGGLAALIVALVLLAGAALAPSAVQELEAGGAHRDGSPLASGTPRLALANVSIDAVACRVLAGVGVIRELAPHDDALGPISSYAAGVEDRAEAAAARAGPAR